jgi:hypothetical protein
MTLVHIMALAPMLVVYFLSPSHQSLSVCVYPIVAWQQLGENHPVVDRQCRGNEYTRKSRIV